MDTRLNYVLDQLHNEVLGVGPQFVRVLDTWGNAAVIQWRDDFGLKRVDIVYKSELTPSVQIDAVGMRFHYPQGYAEAHPIPPPPPPSPCAMHRGGSQHE